MILCCKIKAQTLLLQSKPQISCFMLRNIRVALAALFFAAVTLLFLDFTGTLDTWLGWTAKMQFLPALLALNFGVVAFLVLLTLVFGRVYCSVICPLGVMQDIAARLGRKRKKNRYSYSPAKSRLRYGVLALFVIALSFGAVSLAALVAPYSSYGRIASNLFAPLYGWGNNLLASLAERAGSYAFYDTDVWLKSLPAFITAAATFVILSALAWRNGRTYCNTVCPVGTVLGFIARFSWLKPVIDTEKCVGCKLCARNCKAACIDAAGHRIDYSRCVACMDCIGKCNAGAIAYTHPRKTAKQPCAAAAQAASGKPDGSRRAFLAAAALTAASAAVKAQEKKVDGGLAFIEDKKIPARKTHILPPGADSARRFARRCTACQLCVSVCPNGVLRPSDDLSRFMQPEMSYERGYCRPECVKCSEVCPTGAISLIDLAEKSSVKIGSAVWVKQNCIAATGGVHCDNCARHCPAGAIQMIPYDEAARDKGGAGNEGRQDGRPTLIPAINIERCIGCGACENLCPARPFSAIYVEGNETHSTI